MYILNQKSSEYILTFARALPFSGKAPTHKAWYMHSPFFATGDFWNNYCTSVFMLPSKA